jgi:hypothetical protein
MEKQNVLLYINITRDNFDIVLDISNMNCHKLN